MKKGGKSRFLGILIMIVLLLSIAHVTIHTIVYQTNIPLAKTIGISGNTIGKIDITDKFEEDIRQNYPQISLISKAILIGEWGFLITVLIFLAVGARRNTKREYLSFKKIQKGDKSKTDIDLLYDLIKEKKRIRLSSVSRIFEVDKTTAKKWGEILENADLATIEYPRMGEPEITFNEDDEKTKTN